MSHIENECAALLGRVASLKADNARLRAENCHLKAELAGRDRDTAQRQVLTDDWSPDLYGGTGFAPGALL